jgi:GntR family transcriptional regulator
MIRPPWYRTPTYLEVAADIRDQIASGALEPGDAIPSETAMHQVYGISRPTIRRVVGQLRAEGLVVTIQGTGTYVRKVRYQHRVELPAGATVSARMPTPTEGERYGLTVGQPVLVIQRGETTAVLPADRVVVHTVTR